MSSVEIGIEWVVDASGCDSSRLRSSDAISAVFSALERDLHLHPVGKPLFHTFPPPGGITAFLLLSESHLACHTYPELGAATFNLHCCRERPEWPWAERLGQFLNASFVNVRRLSRSIPAPEFTSVELAK